MLQWSAPFALFTNKKMRARPPVSGDELPATPATPAVQILAMPAVSGVIVRD